MNISENRCVYNNRGLFFKIISNKEIEKGNTDQVFPFLCKKTLSLFLSETI